MAYQGEQIGNSLATRLEAGLAAALDVVEAAWTARGDTLALPDAVTWFEGYYPTIAELPSTSFPFVAVMVQNREPQRGRIQWGYQDATYAVWIYYFVVAADEATVNKVCYRYAEALVSILQSERTVEGFQQVDWEPEVRVQRAVRHGTTPNADMFESSQVDFIQMGEVTVYFE